MLYIPYCTDMEWEHQNTTNHHRQIVVYTSSIGKRSKRGIKFPEIFQCHMYGCEFENFQRKISEKLLLFSGNFQKFVNYLCQSAVSKSSIAKWCCKISMFLTNISAYLCALTLCIMLRENNLFLARLPGISAISNENYRHYNFQAFVNISRNIKFLENLQP